VVGNGRRESRLLDEPSSGLSVPKRSTSSACCRITRPTLYAGRWPHQAAGAYQAAHDLEDLVFNVPLPSIPADQQVSNVLGLALINYAGSVPQVVAIAETNAWERQQQASTF